MKRRLLCAAAVAVALALISGGMEASAAGRDPHLGYVYPAGGQRGTSFDVMLGGQFLYDSTNVVVSGTGISVTIVERERQLTPKEQNDLKETLEKIQAKRKKGETLTVEEIKKAEEIRDKLVAFGRKLQNPSLGEFVKVRVEIAADAPVGRRELRMQTNLGLSNPMAFLVDTLPEYAKEPWKNVPEKRGSMAPRVEASGPPREVTLPATLNGQIPPGVVDRYRFDAIQGQRLVVRVRARDLIPYIADAVPGWFQATVTLKDGAGKEVAYDDDFRFQPDPVLFYRIPASGSYVLEVKDALFRGREDFVYRISAGELPFVTDVFPLGGRVGTKSAVHASGWNLLFVKMPLDLSSAEPGIHAFPFVGFDNVVKYDADTLPEVLEKDGNDLADSAQALETPVVVNGRIEKPGDVDVFRFSGREGQAVVAEVLARRLDSPVDSMLVLLDASGKVVAANDDHEDKGVGLETHHADSFLSVTLPSSGDYFLRIADTQQAGGPAYAYRLRVSAPRPDFELRTTPSSLTVRGGASVPVTVYALRRDGFAGDIDLSLVEAPLGFALSGGRIPGKEDRVQVTLMSPPVAAATAPQRVRIVGRATIEGRTVTRDAVPADDLMQAFAYRHLVPAQSQEVLLLQGSAALAVRLLSPTPVRIPAGGTARVQVQIPAARWAKGEVHFDLAEPPAGVTLTVTRPAAGPVELVFAADDTAKVGAKGNLIVTASVSRGPPADKPKAPVQKFPVGSLPAIPFEIVPAGS